MSEIGSNSHMNLEKILSQRYTITDQERIGIRDTIDSIDNKIKLLSARVGAKPKDTVESITSKVRTLEHEHATTTQSKADERLFMKELERLGQLKKQAVEYQKVKDELDALKEHRADLFLELRTKEKTLDELGTGLNRVRIAGKLQCSTQDIIEQTFVVPEEAIARVIGKKGQNLKQIETDFSVSIATERNDRSNTTASNPSIRIMGSEAAINKAYGAIMNVVNTSSLVIKPSDETIVCLLLNKAALNSEIQTRHNVRLDTSRARNECKITGVGSAIAAAVVEINKIDSYRVQIENVEASVLPFIVGKGGAIIKSLEEEHNVQIDILREENRITLLGLRSNVDSASAFLQNLVVENKEVEDTIKANRHVIITCILGAAGATCKQLQKDLNASIKVVRSAGDNDLDTIIIRGSAAKVVLAKAHLVSILRAFYSQTCRVEVPKDCLPVIVGKKGSKINSLREEHPGSTIDIEGLVVYIQSPSETSRLAIKKSIENLVASNYIKAIAITPDLAILFKGTRGSNLRDLYTNTLELGFEIESDNATMKLRGKQENVEKGYFALQQFIHDNFSIDIPCDMDDCTAFSTSDKDGVDSPQKRVENDHKVDIYVNRKDGILRVRGTDTSVKNALIDINKFLFGDINMGSFVMEVNKQAFSAVIGKAGVTLKKIESTYDVKLDLLKNKGLIRIRGSKESILTAKQYLSKFLDEVRSTVFVDIPTDRESIVTDEFITLYENMFHVEIAKSDFSTNKLTIKGLIRLVDLASEHLTSALDKLVHVKVRASPSQISYLNSISKFKELEGKFSEINIVANAETGEVVCSGPPHEAGECRKDVLQILKLRFPAEFTSNSLSSSCLLDIASKNTEWLSESSGAGIVVDLPLQVVHVFGTAMSVKLAVESLRSRQISWVDTHPSLPIDEFLLPTFVGKNGSGILQLEKDLQVRVKVNRAEKRIELESADKELIQKAVKYITEKVENMKARHWEVTMPPDLLGLLIGKEGSSIKKFRLETNVSVDIDNASGLVRIMGERENVTEARLRILGMIHTEENNNFVIELPVPSTAYPIIIGPGGSYARDIQEKTNTRFELDRIKCVVIIRGSEENCRRTVVLVEEQLEKNGIFLKPKAETVDAVEEVKPEEVVELRPPKVCPGASPALLQKQMSKSALRRLKRKQTGAGEKEEDDEGETKTESTATITTSSVVTTAIVTPAPAVVKPVETLSMADLMMMDDFTTPGSPFQLSSLSKLTLGTNSVPATAPIAATSTSTTNLTPSAKPAASFASTPALPPGLWTEAKNEVHSTSIPSATNAPTASTASDGKYYKSRSGFSVRL